MLFAPSNGKTFKRFKQISVFLLVIMSFWLVLKTYTIWAWIWICAHKHHLMHFGEFNTLHTPKTSRKSFIVQWWSQQEQTFIPAASHLAVNRSCACWKSGALRSKQNNIIRKKQSCNHEVPKPDTLFSPTMACPWIPQTDWQGAALMESNTVKELNLVSRMQTPMIYNS